MFYILYPFVTYLWTLPHNTEVIVHWLSSRGLGSSLDPLAYFDGYKISAHDCTLDNLAAVICDWMKVKIVYCNNRYSLHTSIQKFCARLGAFFFFSNLGGDFLYLN
jgi:hypothetical protein